MSPVREQQAGIVAKVAASATAGSFDEQRLRYELEEALESACAALGIGWATYQLARGVRRLGAGMTRFADVVHGAVVIGYRAPGSFRSGRAAKAVSRARDQVEEYVELLSAEEGRPLTEYVLVVWDGASISFGNRAGDGFRWEPVLPFDSATAERLLDQLAENGAPLVHPALLAQLSGPDSGVGSALIPKLFHAVRGASAESSSGHPSAAVTGRTRLMFAEWRRMFGQVAGVHSGKIAELLVEQGRCHGADYPADPAAYLFALNTYIALVAKLVAAMALPNPARNVADPAITVEGRIEALESGCLFSEAGVLNMFNGDFFAWYRHDPNWQAYASDIEALIDTLRAVNFDVSRKIPESAGDLFKGLYMNFVPCAFRHALGEYYTPDWLAAHALDQIGWTSDQGLGDPTAGSGTFVLEAVRRRLIDLPDAGARELLVRLWGLDLNPLAVLVARASLLVLLADRLDPTDPILLPVYLADAINPVTAVEGTYEHRLQTEQGERTLRLPAELVESEDFYGVLARAREFIEAGWSAELIDSALGAEFELGYPRNDFVETLETLVALHADGWNGVWCAILADRFTAGAIPPGAAIAGNPPWVKWSHLPPQYAEFVKDRCLELGVFGVDCWVGGIESDISTVITYEVIDKYLQDGGTLAFFITGTVFANESSQGFRRWHLKAAGTGIAVRFVEDFAAVAPFEGVRNHATLLVLTKGESTIYPVPYRVWYPSREAGSKGGARGSPDAAAFRAESSRMELRACPVPGTDAGPWLKGTSAQQNVWRHLFGAQEPAYQARKGVTTDANGIYFVKVAPTTQEDMVEVINDPSNGRRAVPTVRHCIESIHVFPLLRGKGVTAFQAVPDSTYRIVVPQRGMHGDPDLPVTAPKTHQWFTGFHSVLEARSSYKRFQRRQGAPYWSLWSIGAYTFSPFKVVWREMLGGRFAAGYVGTSDDPVLGAKLVIPDHKLYFVPCGTEDEAAYLTGLLNAPVVSEAVSGYAAQLSLGASVVEYLLIPAFEPADSHHRDLAELAKRITAAGMAPASQQQRELDLLAAAVQGIPDDVLAAARADAADPAVRTAEHQISP